jgi:hypothetical protein
MRKFESFRLETYRLIMEDETADSRTARRNMLKAYITFAMDINNLVAKQTFGECVQEISDQQSVFVERMAKGEDLEDIDTDPRTLKNEVISAIIEKSDVKDETAKFRERQRTQRLKKKIENQN